VKCLRINLYNLMENRLKSESCMSVVYKYQDYVNTDVFQFKKISGFIYAYTHIVV